MTTVSFKLADADLRRIPARNRSDFFRTAVLEKLAATAPAAKKKPERTWVKKMRALRQAHTATGVTLLDADQIAAEIRARRGGLA